MKLRVLAKRIYPESQCGFRAKRATIDMISLRQLQEKCREQGKPLYVAFIDLTKVFDLVSRDGLFKILAKIGCPPTLFSIVKSFHDNMKGTVLYDGATSDPFNILSGVKQGCVLAPTLFGIFFATLLKHDFGECQPVPPQFHQDIFGEEFADDVEKRDAAVIVTVVPATFILAESDYFGILRNLAFSPTLTKYLR